MDGPKGLGIHIKVKDINESRKFYESLGFQPVFGYGDDEFRASLPDGCDSAPEKYRGITYAIGANAKLEVADGHIAVKPEVFSEEVASPKVSAMVEVDSLAPILEKMKDRIRFPVRSYYWGTVELVIKDPDGFVLIFIAKKSDEELANVKKLIEVEDVQPS